MISGQSYYKRVGYVSIQGNDGKMHSYGGNDGLDFKFSGEKYGSIYVNFEVSILGLNASTINDLTVWNPAEAISASRRIEVYAGYENGGIANPIFEGIIIEAIPTNPPEMWLNFKCMKLASGTTDASGEVSMPGMIIGDMIGNIFTNIAHEFGLNAGWDCNKPTYDTIVNFDYSGSRGKICEKFAQTFDITVYEEDGTLWAKNKREQCEDPQGLILPVNINNGLLGLTNVTLVGADIKMRLNDKSKLMSWVRLESKLIPKANGLYYVIRKKHTGHFRGEEWFTELQTLRKGAKA